MSKIMDPIGGMIGLVKAAMSGHFAVDGGTGQAMIGSLEEMRDAAEKMLDSVHSVASEPAQLGGLPEARAVAKLDMMVAAGGDRSLATVLLKFRDSLDEAIRAVQIGMANYQQVEANTRESMERGLRDDEVST